MYTDSEILQIARGCNSIHEVMKAAKILRELIKDGAQAPSIFINYTMVKRFRELIS